MYLSTSSPNNNILHIYQTRKINIGTILWTQLQVFLGLLHFPHTLIAYCIVLWNVTLCIDLCDHHHQQDTELWFLTTNECPMLCLPGHPLPTLTGHHWSHLHHSNFSILNKWYKWNYIKPIEISFFFQLAYCPWDPSKLLHVFGRSFFFYPWVVFCCQNVPKFVLPFTNWVLSYIWVVSGLWLLQIKLLCTLRHRNLCKCKFIFL